MVKWSSRNESFEDLETKGKTKSGMNKAVKIVLKGQVQKRKQDEVALTTVSMISPEQIHEKRWLKAPEMAETSSAQSAKERSACVEFVKKYRSLKAERNFFWNECPKYFFRSGYCVPGENRKKAMDHLGLFKLHDLSHSMP